MMGTRCSRPTHPSARISPLQGRWPLGQQHAPGTCYSVRDTATSRRLDVQFAPAELVLANEYRCGAHVALEVAGAAVIGEQAALRVPVAVLYALRDLRRLRAALGLHALEGALAGHVPAGLAPVQFITGDLCKRCQRGQHGYTMPR